MTAFKKGTPRGATARRKRPPPPKKRARPSPETPATRVGPGQTQVDTIAPRDLYVLVDEPASLGRDALWLEQRMKSFVKKEPAETRVSLDTTLVDARVFQHITDGGRLTLTWRRGDSEDQQPVVLFEEVPGEELLLDDADLVNGDADPFPNRRALDRQAVAPRPATGDEMLGWPYVPYETLVDGSKGG